MPLSAWDSGAEWIRHCHAATPASAPHYELSSLPTSTALPLWSWHCVPVPMTTSRSQRIPADLIDALLDRSPELPPVPHMPLGLSRVCWEHIMRVHEQCGRNVTATAQCLRMHRRSLQRILGKRAPPPRADLTCANQPVHRFAPMPEVAAPACGPPRGRSSCPATFQCRAAANHEVSVAAHGGASVEKRRHRRIDSVRAATPCERPKP